MGDCKPIVKFLQRSRVSTFLLILEALLTTGAQGAIVQRPKNLAMSVGGSSYFNCSTNSTGSITWVFSLDGNIASSSAKEMTNGNCDILANFSGNFRTEKPNSDVCNLIVFNANLQLGGYYACFTGFGASATFQGILVVADTRSNIATNVTEFTNDCEENAFFKMTVHYSGPSPIPPSTLPALFPSLKWTLKSEPSNTIPILENVTTTTSSFEFIVDMIPSVPSYVCTLYFKPSTNPPTNCDNSTPSFAFSWETPAINTSCIELNTSSIIVTSCIESVGSGSCEVKVLECRPNAYPPPHDVHWLDVIHNEVVNGTRITAEFGGEYICSVTNAINGHYYSANVNYELNDDSAFTMDKCKGVSEVNITVSRNNPSEMDAVKTSSKVNLHSNERATEITIENATEAIITCIADGLPEPSYIWNDPCNAKANHQQILANASGSYECEASNSICDRIFRKSATIHVNLPSAAPLKCADTKPGQQSDDGWLLLLILLLLVFLLPACVFLPYYGFSKSCRENVNDEFPWIEKALPCMNGKGCECSGGMVLFIFCLVICGVVFVPWILIASYCCQRNSKKSQETRYADNSRNSAANGHPEPSHYQGLERNTQTTQVYEGLSQRPEYANAIGNDDFGRSLTLETNSHQQTQTPYEELQRNQQRPMVVYQELIR